MNNLDRPCLRRYLAISEDPQHPGRLILWDPRHISTTPLRVTRQEFLCLQLFTGQHDLRDVQALAIAESGGMLIPIEALLGLVRRLDEALLLDGPAYHSFLSEPVRAPSCIGCYEGDPELLRRQIRAQFTHPNGPGLPADPTPDGRLRAALLPHIDYGRGGPSFAWGFKEVYEQTDASLFVIIGTSHHSPHRFTLTRKNFSSPLGVVETDQEYIDALIGEFGDGLFEDEGAHLPEHSIELEVVFLQYLYEGKRPFRIVPLVVGSFHDCVAEEASPSEAGDIRRMIDAIRRVEERWEQPICYLISGDLAHIGPKFGDREEVGNGFLKLSREQDRALMSAAESADPERYFRVIAGENDRRRICGLPPTYTVLAALRPSGGKLLHYDQYVHPRGFESVSFASVAFYR